MKNSAKIEGKIVPSHICQKYVIHWQKTCSGCQLNFKFCTQLNHLFSRKNLKITFLTGALIIVKTEFEIYKYLHLIFHHGCHLKIFDAVLRLVFNSSPQFYSHSARSQLDLQ